MILGKFKNKNLDIIPVMIECADEYTLSFGKKIALIGVQIQISYYDLKIYEKENIISNFENKLLIDRITISFSINNDGTLKKILLAGYDIYEGNISAGFSACTINDIYNEIYKYYRKNKDSNKNYHLEIIMYIISFIKIHHTQELILSVDKMIENQSAKQYFWDLINKFNNDLDEYVY
jgi:hypothetical protein